VISTFENGNKRKVDVVVGEQKVEEIVYYENGQIQMKGPVNDEGQRHGNWKSWYDDGKVWTEGRFDNGKRTGKGVIYYTNGQKRCEGMYEDDKAVGEWVFWDDLGKEQRRETY
jgi:antitoxin component YwqK of YwqJK toxin-antitoxin module